MTGKPSCIWTRPDPRLQRKVGPRLFLGSRIREALAPKGHPHLGPCPPSPEKKALPGGTLQLLPSRRPVSLQFFSVLGSDPGEHGGR